MKREKINFDGFGERDPRRMPKHLFSGALHLDYETAVKADVTRQDFTVCPRYWYVDAAFRCGRCGKTFVFGAEEQRFWYEKLKFYVDSCATHCEKCRKALRELKALKKEYDRDVVSAVRRPATMDQKIRLVAVIDALEAGGIKLAGKMEDVRGVLVRQIGRQRKTGGSNAD